MMRDAVQVLRGAWLISVACALSLGVAAYSPVRPNKSVSFASLLAATAETPPPPSGAVAAGIMVLDGDVIGIVGAAVVGGVEVDGLDGARTGPASAGEVEGSDVA